MLNPQNRRRIGAILIAACVALALWKWAGTSSTKAGSADTDVSANQLTVQSAAAHREQWPETIEAFGNIAPWDEITVSAQVEGQPLIELRVNVGDAVQRGQVLARFDTQRLGAEVRGLQAQVEQAIAAVAQANTERDRATRLVDSGGISQQDLLQRVTNAQVAIATLSAARAQLAARELDLRHTEVVAPDEGTVSTRNAQTGMVGTTGLELFRIIRRDRLEWRGELTADQISRAAPGQQVQLTLSGGATASARIRQLAPAMNMQTRQAVVYADIDPNGAVHAGTYVNGRIILGNSIALVVPISSVVVRDGYNFTFKVTAGKPSRVTQHRVDVGRRMGIQVEILAGLNEGDRVVTEGAGFLDDGDSVYDVSEPSAAPRKSP